MITAWSTVGPLSSEMGRHSRVCGGRILGVPANWTRGRCPKWQKSQQCEALCSCMPQTSAMETRRTHAITTHAAAVLNAGLLGIRTEPDYITRVLNGLGTVSPSPAAAAAFRYNVASGCLISWTSPADVGCALQTPPPLLTGAAQTTRAPVGLGRPAQARSSAPRRITWRPFNS